MNQTKPITNLFFFSNDNKNDDTNRTSKLCDVKEQQRFRIFVWILELNNKNDELIISSVIYDVYRIL